MRLPRRSLAIATLVAILVCGASPSSASAGPPLRKLAAQHDLEMGSAAGVYLLDWLAGGVSTPVRDSKKYRKILGGEFGVLATGSDLMWNIVHPGRDTFDFARAEEIITFAEAHDMGVRGHPLVWHQNLPEWLTENTFNKRKLAKILRQHIETVVGHFAGRVRYWDVVNEAIVCTGPNETCTADRGTALRDSIWRKIGTDYIDKAFRWARQADPDAQLFYNDNWHEGFPETNDLRARQDAVYELVKGLVERGVPIDGVGFQMHTIQGIDWGQDPASVAANMQRYADLGLDIHITEMDVRIEEPATKAKLNDQAQVFRRMMDVCLEAANCTLFQVWGFSDRHSWIPSVYEGFGSATIFDQRYHKKPAYKQLAKSLKKR